MHTDHISYPLTLVAVAYRFDIYTYCDSMSKYFVRKTEILSVNFNERFIQLYDYIQNQHISILINSLTSYQNWQIYF